MKFDYDVIIIGSGPAGFSCAMQSTKFDKKVLIIESSSDHLGGTWINKGTVPSKALRSAAKLIQSFHSQFGDEKGRKPYEKFKMDDLLLYKNRILESKNRKVKDDLIKNEVDTARGWGKIIAPHQVEVADQLNKKTVYTTEYILVATGSNPTKPKNFEIDHKNVLDFSSILDITHIPRRLVIVGSGIITIEYATIFSALGTRVTILNESDSILPFLDGEIKAALLQSIKKKNIQLINEVKIGEVGYNDLRTCQEVAFSTPSESRTKVAETEHILYVGSKKPNTGNLGLKEAGVKTDSEGYIEVDSSYRTSGEGIFAAGDAIGDPSLASASFLQGRLAACTMFGSTNELVNSDIPFGIYSIPEISSIGLTEEEATELGFDITVGRAYYNNLTQADVNHETEGLLKLLFKTDDLKLVGVHIFGDQATDLIHLGQNVIASGGTIKYFLERVLNYPSYTEAYRIAAFNGLNRVHKAGVKYKKILERE